jgi:hypothetical protein
MNTYHNKDIKDDQIDTIFESLSSEEEEIILSNNRLTKIDKVPDSIICINLNNNYIEGVNFLVGREWDTVLLSNNNLEITTLKNIKCITLDLSENRIEELTIEDCEIANLDISNNSIKKISFINTRINDIDMSVNKIKELTNYPIGIQNLKLFNNKIKKLEELPETLMILDVSDNKLEDFPKLPLRLRKLDACKNHITFVDITNIPLTIIFLDLTENPIENKDKLADLDIETLYLNEDDASSSFSEIEIPNNIKHRFERVSEEEDNEEDKKEDNYDDFKSLLKDAEVETEFDPLVASMFSNLRGKNINPKIELYAISKSINMNWNIVL